MITYKFERYEDTELDRLIKLLTIYGIKVYRLYREDKDKLKPNSQVTIETSLGKYRFRVGWELQIDHDFIRAKSLELDKPVISFKDNFDFATYLLTLPGAIYTENGVEVPVSKKSTKSFIYPIELDLPTQTPLKGDRSYSLGRLLEVNGYEYILGLADLMATMKDNWVEARKVGEGYLVKKDIRRY